MKLIFGTVPTYSKIFSYTIVRVKVFVGRRTLTKLSFVCRPNGTWELKCSLVQNTKRNFTASSRQSGHSFCPSLSSFPLGFS